MKHRLRGRRVPFLVAAALWSLTALRAQDLPKPGEIGTIVCAGDPDRSYALRLPAAFDPGRRWPVLVLFDPGARGRVAVEAFHDAAEAHGWILAGSNDSRNGPAENNVLSARAVWADLARRLPVDAARVYATGFSGGARVASFFPRLLGRKIAGVIGCGAGLAQGLAPKDLGAATYVGVVGLSDFNYGEMKSLDRDLDVAGVPHRMLFIEGVHDWPSPDACVRAVGWMEAAAMAQGLRPRDEAFARAVVDRELAEAAELERAARPFWAADRLEAAEFLADGLVETTGVKERIAALKASKAYRAFVEDEAKRDRRAVEFRRDFGRAFGAVEGAEESPAAAVPEVLQAMRIASLRKTAKAAKTVEDRSLASRLLFEFSFAAQARASELEAALDRRRAAAYLDLAIEACEEGLAREKGLYFMRARVAAAAGDKKTALKFLASAVEKGFAMPEIIESTKAFDSLRSSDGYKAVMQKMREKAGETEKD